MTRRRTPIALTLVLGLALTLGRLAAPAAAAPKGGGVDPSALLSADGHTVAVSVVVDCSQSAGRPVILRVTLTQAPASSPVEVPPSQYGPALFGVTSSGGAVLEGLWQKSCSDANTAWTITLTVGGDGSLKPGAADVAVLDSTDAVQWIGQTQLVTSQPR